MKRRAVERQVLINQSFPQCKAKQFEAPYNIAKNSEDSECARGLNLHYQNGAQKKTTPYRSMNRVNSLLKASPYSANYGSSKLTESSQGVLSQVALLSYNFDLSKPSSVTTAMTKATTVYDGPSSRREPQKVQQQRDCKKKGKRDLNEAALIELGVKRAPQLKLEDMEYFTRLGAKAQTKLFPQIKLTDKKTGQSFDFPLHEQKQLKGFKNSEIIRDFDMTKLEVEYDYDTDAEQQKHSQRMLLHELSQAIEFYVREEPIKLVDNVLL